MSDDLVVPKRSEGWTVGRVPWVLAATAALGCHAQRTTSPEPVAPAPVVSEADSIAPAPGWPKSQPLEQWSGEEIEQEHQAELVRGADDDEDDRAPDVDGVPHVDRVELSEARRDALGVDHLGLDGVYLVERNDGLVLSTLAMDAREFVAIADELEAIAERTGGDPPWIREHPALVTFTPGQTMTVVSSAGVARRRLREFSAYRGASEGHLLARLEGSRSGPARAIALRGSAHPEARLRTPKPARPSEAVLTEVRGQVGDPALADRVQPHDLEVVPVRFRSKGSQLVVLSLYLDEVDDEWTAELSGAFVREPDGHVHVLVPIRRRHQPVDLDFLVDLDGDHIDEIAFRTDDASCGYRYLAVWDGRAYRNLRLEGSGG